MIEVQNLTKRYSGFTAVNDISFKVAKGEIVGFLGPNGAGKSTTMRILSSFMPATSGYASVAGFDVFSESIEARRRLGYMPENVPLYAEMRVSEYLRYRASIKGLFGRRIRERVGAVVEMCSLEDKKDAVIRTLSKGYKQRVGLADALVHDPDLLILDEPTIGLDPNQIRQVRELIRTLGQRHTILLSSHILPEVEAVCSRVIIINKGRIEKIGTPAELESDLRRAGGIRIEANTGADNGAELLGKITGVREVTADGTGEWQTFTLRVEAGADLREEIYRLAVERRWKLRELTRQVATLEDVFVEITQSDI
jgi:ABC-2 type transport system ATP-binding protein